MAKGKKTGGRTKGGSKITKETKENLLIAFDRLNGIAGLVEWAKENPTDFYKIWARTMTVTVGGDPKNPLIPSEIRIKLV